MASNTFIYLAKKTKNNPCLLFFYDSLDRTRYLVSVSNISRNSALEANTVTITVDNSTGAFDDFLSNHRELCKKVELYFSFGSFVNYDNFYYSYTANTIAFHDNGSDPDTITDSSSKFLTYNFCAGMPLVVSGSTYNDGTYIIDNVTSDTITLSSSDSLTNESAGANVTLDNEDIPLFVGYVEGVRYDYETGLMKLECRDRLSMLLEKRVFDESGGVIYPKLWNYFAIDGSTRQNARVVSGIVWDILTDYVGLDDTEGTGNSDIDYTSFTSWASVVDDGGYSIYDIACVSYSESANSLLMKICQLTESVIWVSGAGKLKFKSSMQSISGQVYDKSVVKSLKYFISIDDRINYIKCKWGYNPAYDIFQSDGSGIVQTYKTYGPNSEPYVYQVKVEDDRIVSHNSTTSANKYMAERLNRTAPPPRIFEITTDVLGFVEDIGNDITLQNFFSTPYDDFDIRIEEIRFDVDNWTVDIIGRFFWTAGELL